MKRFKCPICGKWVWSEISVNGVQVYYDRDYMYHKCYGSNDTNNESKRLKSDKIRRGNNYGNE